LLLGLNAMFVVIGTTTVDLFVQGLPNETVLEDGFRAVNLIFAEEPLRMLMGGNGGNSAYVLGRLGAEVSLCSSVGEDNTGDWLVQKLAGQGVDLTYLTRCPDLATSSSTILFRNAERQAVVHHKGATNALTITPEHKHLYAQADILLASSYSLFPLMRAGGFAEALRLTHEAGGVTAVDIGPAIGEPVKTAEIAPLLHDIDYLIANAHELRVCTETGEWETGAAILLDLGCRHVVIKRGAHGAALRSPGVSVDVTAFPVVTNISVGAGDSFNAGFLYGLWQNRTLEEALCFGSAVAALVVSGQQGVLSAPTVAEVDELVRVSSLAN
jgi:sugar/nucleoside kinase (ribokinase family)